MQTFIDHHSFLVQSNLLTDEMKDNIAMCAWVLVEDVIDASTFIDFNKKVVNYRLVLPKDLAEKLDLLEKYQQNPKSLGFFEIRRLNKFLTKKAKNDESGLSYNLTAIGERFARGYLTKEWKVKVEYIAASNSVKQAQWLDEYTQEF